MKQAEVNGTFSYKYKEPQKNNQKEKKKKVTYAMHSKM
jgi:hypothetical protein